MRKRLHDDIGKALAKDWGSLKAPYHVREESFVANEEPQGIGEAVWKAQDDNGEDQLGKELASQTRRSQKVAEEEVSGWLEKARKRARHLTTSRHSHEVRS
ncbi:hypothetical protein LTR86_008777 [Recurvomyces mirabilis]|nr:hypothetical protein LTR86_008777 [Recurvomyces mirabilis]